jgi:hypothetical protein
MATQDVPDGTRSISDPASNAFTITPADADFTTQHSGIYVGGAGTLIITFKGGGGPFTLTVAAGTVLPFRAKRIAAASTATGILGLVN